MTDMGYFACLAATIFAAITAVFTARAIIRGGGGSGTAIALAIASCIGPIVALPFRTTHEMPWFPAVAAILFGSVVLSTVLCLLFQIREQTKPRD